MYTLKYYTNGWNFVQVKEPQHFNLDTSKLMKDAKSRLKGEFTLDELEAALYVLISNKVFDNRHRNDPMVSDFRLTRKFYQHLMENQLETNYIRVVIYMDEDDQYRYIVYQGPSYLLNEDGHTLEIFSRDKFIE